MKIENLGAKILISMAAALLAFFFGTYGANWVYRNYEPVVKGILGVILLAMIYHYIIPKGLAKNSSRAWPTITILKLVVLSVFWGAVGYWAIRELIDMVFYFINLANSTQLMH